MSGAWRDRAKRVLDGESVTREEALSILRAPDSDLEDIVEGAFLLRHRHHGKRVRLHVLLNAKSGLCPEDCGFCSQSSRAKAPVETYPLVSKERIVEAARRAKELRAWRFCMSTAMRGPTDKDVEVICEAVREIRATVGIPVCMSIGFVTPEQAARLKESGVDRFNHNLETSERYFPKVVTTHKYGDRVDTVRRVKASGLEACCGVIVGQGETLEDVVDVAFALRDLDADAIPVNFLNPRPGTPFGGRPLQKPEFCLKVLAMFRFVNPSKEIRAAGGREVNLGPLQGKALRVVNSIFTEGYLTTPGNQHEQDVRMIRELGFELESC